MPNAGEPGSVRSRVCACEHVESAGWKSLPKFGLDFVAGGYCVVARRGGKQPEANDWSVGNELDSAGSRGELAPEQRSPRRS